MSSKIDFNASSFNNYLDICIHTQQHVFSKKRRAKLFHESQVFSEYLAHYKVFRKDDLYLLEQIKRKCIVCFKFADSLLLKRLETVIKKLKTEYRLSDIQLSDLPSEVVQHILSFLAEDEFSTICLVSNQWKMFAENVLAGRINEESFLNQNKVKISNLIRILKHCGVKVHTLTLGTGFRDGKNLNDQTFKLILQGCPNLYALNLRCIHKITDEGMKAISSCLKLQVLTCSMLMFKADSLKGCTELEEIEASEATSLGVARLFKLSKLTKLDLEGCVNISDFGLKYVLPKTILRSLNLNKCARITDVSLMLLVENMRIEVLRLRHTQVTNKVIMAIARSQNPALHTLDIGHTNVTDAGVESLLWLPGLRVLNIEGLKIGQEIIHSLLKSTMNVPTIIA